MSGRGVAGQCQVIINGKRCPNKWQRGYRTKQFCSKCKARLKQQRHRARLKD